MLKIFKKPYFYSHLAAIKEPLFHGLGISPHQRDIQIIMKGIYGNQPIERKLPPQWSLAKVLEELKKEIYSDESDTSLLLMKAIFLIA